MTGIIYIGIAICLLVGFFCIFATHYTSRKIERQMARDFYSYLYFKPTPRTYNHVVELSCYNKMYDELYEKCNPSNYMNPYDDQKVRISNQIFSQLEENKDNESGLISLRNKAIEELGLDFGAKELFDALANILNPQNYVGENYDAEMLSRANLYYPAVLSHSDDIIELEKIADMSDIYISSKKKK